MKGKLLWKTQAPLPITSSSLCSPPSPSITSVFTVVQNPWHAHSQSTQPRGHLLEGQLTQDILLHISNLPLLPLCITGMIRSSAFCFRKTQGSLYTAQADTAQHLPVGVPTHTGVQFNWGSKHPSLGPVSNKYIFCPQSHIADGKGAGSPARLQPPIN